MVPPDQPVRFYKFIALTFLLLTIVLLGMVVFMSSKRATITITTKQTPSTVNASVVVGTDSVPNGIPGTVTTTVVALSTQQSVNGEREEPGVATGVATLHNETDFDQPLVINTRLLTPEGVLFRMAEPRTIPANGTIEVPVFADEEGASGNIGPTARFSIPGLNEVKQQVIYASSAAPMTGGVRKVGVLAQSDVDAAKEVMERQLTDALHERFEGESYVLGLSDVSYVVSEQLGTEVNGFEISATGTAVVALYDEDALKAWAVSELMNRSIGDTEIVSPGEGDPSVSFSAYDQQTNLVTMDVFLDGTVTLNPESKQIEKAMFFGKNKDEVRRYLLSLDHVQKVEVGFQPVWMQTVPHIHDHVTVVVKEVE